MTRREKLEVQLLAIARASKNELGLRERAEIRSLANKLLFSGITDISNLLVWLQTEFPSNDLVLLNEIVDMSDVRGAMEGIIDILNE